MSGNEENVERLRRLFDLVGDGENPEALYELLALDIEFSIAQPDPDAGIYHGHQGVRDYFRRWAGTWERWHFHPEQLIAIGDNKVAVALYQRGRGRASGVEVENRPGQLWTFRDALVVRWQNFASFEDALAAADRTP